VVRGRAAASTKLSDFGAWPTIRSIVEAAAQTVQIVKPQVAYFEQFGAAGYEALAQTIEQARSMGLLVIADAKRGDIGSTSDAYGRAWLGTSSPMQADAITVSPYLGFGAIEPLLNRAVDAGAYVFVVVRSSNPEGSPIQTAGEPGTWVSLLDEIAGWSSRNCSETVGAVVGATVPDELAFALDRLPEALFLAPGIGRQGASLSELKDRDLPLNRVIVSSSRGIAEVGPDAQSLRNAVSQLIDIPSS
jgi:orotidine-5'-phosphate decarboxylase